MDIMTDAQVKCAEYLSKEAGIPLGKSKELINKVLFKAKATVRKGSEVAKDAVRKGTETAKETVIRGTETAKDAVRKGTETAKNEFHKGVDAVKNNQKVKDSVKYVGDHRKELGIGAGAVAAGATIYQAGKAVGKSEANEAALNNALANKQNNEKVASIYSVYTECDTYLKKTAAMSINGLKSTLASGVNAGVESAKKVVNNVAQFGKDHKKALTIGGLVGASGATGYQFGKAVGEITAGDQILQSIIAPQKTIKTINKLDYQDNSFKTASVQESCKKFLEKTASPRWFRELNKKLKTLSPGYSLYRTKVDLPLLNNPELQDNFRGLYQYNSKNSTPLFSLAKSAPEWSKYIDRTKPAYGLHPEILEKMSPPRVDKLVSRHELAATGKASTKLFKELVAIDKERELSNNMNQMVNKLR